MVLEKLTPTLVSQMEKSPEGHMLDIVVELGQPGESVESAKTRQEQIAIRKQYFTEKKLPVQAKIQELGGSVIDSAWINHTLRARVPARSLKHLTDLQSVERVDVPRSLEPEKS